MKTLALPENRDRPTSPEPALESAHWSLKSGEVRSLHLPPGEWASVQIRSGHCWLTMEGDSSDYVLSEGEAEIVQGSGLLVVEAIGGSMAAQIRFTGAIPTTAG